MPTRVSRTHRITTPNASNSNNRDCLLLTFPSCSLFLFACVLCCSAGVPAGFFSHILFDESCQSLEAEALIPLCLVGSDTSVIVAGDHLQLGAEVHSGVAVALGLKTSWQERLLRTDIYKASLARTANVDGNSSSSASSNQSGSNNSCVAIQLNKNYRSHKNLLAISSALFYDGSLRAFASPRVTDSLVGLELLPNRHNFPLLFYGVVGEDIYEESFSSFSNPTEASAVVKIIQQLLHNKKVPGITTNDIGVIGQRTTLKERKHASDDLLCTRALGLMRSPRLCCLCCVSGVCLSAPYRKHVIVLRQLLRACGLGQIRVGSVDDNQGREEKIMVISTVVSRPRAFLGGAGAGGAGAGRSAGAGAAASSRADAPGGVSSSTLPLGILRNAQRFNVALSRAKALTVVVSPCNSRLTHFAARCAGRAEVLSLSALAHDIVIGS